MLDPKYYNTRSMIEPGEMEDGNRGVINVGIITAHEFGHVWADWTGQRNGEHVARDFENMVRRVQDPTAPLRKNP